ncbi:hypothetical protein DOS48_14720 (plasmid) [Halorubrum sp. PV6]|nr:hypothetical protein DOS48_14720 [Halorubrum sp. PV6]
MWCRVDVDGVVPPRVERAEWCVAAGQLEASCVVSVTPIGVVGVPVCRVRLTLEKFGMVCASVL